MAFWVFLLFALFVAQGWAQCNVQTASHNHPIPFDSSNVQTNGGAQLLSEGNIKYLQLINAASTDSSAFFKQLLPFKGGFSTTFEFTVSSDKCDGFAFVFHTNGLNARGDSGYNLGLNFENSVAIEFDCWANTGVSGDKNWAFGVNTKGKAKNSPVSASQSNENAWSAGNRRWVEIRVLPTSTSNQYMASIYYSTSQTLPTTPTWTSQPITINADASPANGPTGLKYFEGFNAFFGFTAGSNSTSTAKISIYNWSMKYIPVDAAKSKIKTPASEYMKRTVSDSNPTTAVISIQTVDACGNDMTISSFNFPMTVDLTTTSNDALATDSWGWSVVASGSTYGNGIYQVYFWHKQAESRKLIIRQRGNNVQGTPATIQFVPDVPDPTKSSFTAPGLNELTAGQVADVDITLVDRFGNSITDTIDPTIVSQKKIYVDWTSPASLGPFAVTANGNKFRAQIKHTKTESSLQLFVQVNNNNINGSPKGPYQIKPSVVAPSQSQLYGDLGGKQAGQQSTLSLYLYDEFGNQLNNINNIAVTATVTSENPNHPSVTPTVTKSGIELNLVTITYTINKAGSYLLDIKVDGVSVRNDTITITSGVTSAPQSYITNSSTPTAGSPVILTLVARDQFQNEGPIAQAPFNVTLSASGIASTATVTCRSPRSAADFQDLNVTSFYCSGDGQPYGQFQIAFTPQLQTTYTVKGVLSNQETPSSSVAVIAGAASASRSSLSETSSTITAGQDVAFDVFVADAFGNERLSFNDASIIGISGLNVEKKSVVRDATQTNKYRVTVTSKVATQNVDVLVSIGAENIATPFKLTVNPDDAVASKSSVVAGDFGSDGLYGAKVNQAVHFYVITRDQYENIVPAEVTCSSGSLAYVIQLNYGTSSDVSFSCSRASQAEGKYKVSYTIIQDPPENLAEPSVSITVSINNEAIADTYGGPITRENEVSNAKLFDLPAPSTPAGVLVPVTIHNVDQNNNPITNKKPVFSFYFEGGDAEVVSAPVQSQTEPHKYTATLKFITVGSTRVHLVADGAIESIDSKNVGYYVTVTIGALDPKNSEITGLPETIVAGNQTTYTLQAVDVAGNKFTTSPGNLRVAVSGSDYTSSHWSQQVTSNGDGTYTITLTLTKASTGVTVWHCFEDVCSSSNSAERKPSVIYNNPSPSTTVFSMSLTSWVAAGSPIIATIEPKDIYGNKIDKLTSQNFEFVMATDPNVPITNFQSNDGSYTFTFTPTVSDYTKAQSFSINIHTKNVLNGSDFTVSIQQPSKMMVYVRPADFDPQQSTFEFDADFLAKGRELKAGEEFSGILTVKDKYGNPWRAMTSTGETSDINLRAYISNGPDIRPYINLELMTDSDHGKGKYKLTISPTISSYAGDSVVAYNLEFRMNMKSPAVVFLPGSSNPLNFTVRPAEPEPSRTIILPLNSTSWSADDSASLDVVLRDKYDNVVFHEDFNDNVGVEIYERTQEVTATGSVQQVCSKDASSHTANFTVVQTELHTRQARYRLTLTGRIAKKYYGLLSVKNTLLPTEKPSDCTTSNVAMSFEITPGAIDPSKSWITGPGVEGGRAGTNLTFYIYMRDSYENLVSTFAGDDTVLLGPATFDTTKCDSFDSGLIITATATPANGYYEATYLTTKAGKAALFATVNNQVVGVPQECRIVVIKPSLVASVNISIISPAGIIVAGEPIVFELKSFDASGNAIEEDEIIYDVGFFREGGSEALATYSFTRSTSGKLVGGAQNLSVALSWEGNYIAKTIGTTVVDLTDPVLIAQVQKIETETPFQVVPAVCGADDPSTPIRCSDGTCVEDASKCSGGSTFKCPDGTTTSDLSTCNCPASMRRCPQGHCVSAASECPESDVEDCSLHFDSLITCATKECRRNISDCPENNVGCPHGFALCSDGVSCARTPGDCFSSASIVCNQNAYRCFDGRCVDRLENCATRPTCPAGQVLCSDFSCKASADLCREEFACLAPNTFRCQDGSCRQRAEDCPSRKVCPVGSVMCESGVCVPTLDDCKPALQCKPGEIRCGDGSCAKNILLCPSTVTCPHDSDKPILCASGECVRDISECRPAIFCSNPLRPQVCPGGFCVPENATCPILRTCPTESPVLCPDGSCMATVSDCPKNVFTCPAHVPYRCPDGSCRNTEAECPILAICPATAPFRCPDGSCVTAREMCNVVGSVSCTDGIRCPDGSCAPDASVCPSIVTCPAEYTRCFDGSCRRTCPVVDLAEPCDPTTQVRCPQPHLGIACAASLAECPSSVVCPSSRPVRCVDQSCALSLDDCPVPPESTAATACADGSFVRGSTTCTLGISTTCPKNAPVRCWDKSCRAAPEDCPPAPLCPRSSNGARNTPFLCHSGDCKASPDSCVTASECPELSPVRCPFVPNTAAVTFTNVGCTESAEVCERFSPFGKVVPPASAYTSVCPDNKFRCRDGSCVSVSSLCKPVTCPSHLPFRCHDGSCAPSENLCYMQANGCPLDKPVRCQQDSSCHPAGTNCTLVTTKTRQCPANHKFCPTDGSCLDQQDPELPSTCDRVQESGCFAGWKRCADGACHRISSGRDPCVDATTSNARSVVANACPPNFPYKCPDGTCMASSRFCPVIPQPVLACPDSSRPVRCGDGSCVASYDQCPVLRPCSAPGDNLDNKLNVYRCPDGLCRKTAAMCPLLNLCPDDLPYRCQNGRCAADEESCLVLDLTNSTQVGCKSYQVRCPTNGKCVRSVTDPDCPSSPVLGNGCPSATSYKCFDGSCATDSTGCNAFNGCPLATPVLLSNGTCVEKHVAAAPIKSGVICPNKQWAPDFASCKLANGCPITAPIRCANGECKRFPAVQHPGVVLNQTYADDVCPPVVVCSATTPYQCADGSCVASPSSCRPVHDCPSNVECIDSYKTALAAGRCPPSSPAMCPDGSCRASLVECKNVFETQCSDDKPFRCFTGECVDSSVECVRKTATVAGTVDLFEASGYATNMTCESGLVLCYDGSCVPDRLMCPSTPGCPASRPYRCQTGHCVASSNQCPVSAACGVSENRRRLKRCEDGLCREECLPSLGCPLSAPFYCPQRINPCVADAAQCKAVEACDDCDHLIAASRTTFTLDVTSAQSHVDVQVSVDRNNTVRSFIRFPASSGVFANGSYVLIEPMPADYPRKGPQGAINLLSTPFACTVFDKHGAVIPTLPFPGTLQSASDIVRPGSQSSIDGAQDPDTRLDLANPPRDTTERMPCQYMGDFDVDYNKNQAKCMGSLSITRDSITVQTTECDTLQLSGELLEAKLLSDPTKPKTDVLIGISSESRTYCSCYNITKSSYTRDLFPETGFDVGSTYCMLLSYNLKDNTLQAAGFSSGAKSYECPTQILPDVRIYTVNAVSGSKVADACPSVDATGRVLFDARDMCLAFSRAGSEWSCTQSISQRRRNLNPVWEEEDGVPQWRLNGELPSCSASLTDKIYYAFAQINRPAALVAEFDLCQSFLCRSSGIVFTIIVNVAVLFALVGFVIWRMYRYRIKYKMHQKQNEELQDRAQELVQFSGGLGVADADGEIQMVANPLVIEMQKMEEQMKQIEQDLNLKQEEEVAQMDRLEMERQRLMAEIERVKTLLQEQQKQGPTRQTVVISAPPLAASPAAMTSSSSAAPMADPMAASSLSPVAAAAPQPMEPAKIQTDFGQARVKDRKKKEDI